LASQEGDQKHRLVEFFITVDEFRNRLSELLKSTRRGDLITIGKIKIPLERMSFSQKFEVLSFISELKRIAEEMGFMVMKEGVGNNGFLFLGVYRSSVNPKRRLVY